MNTETGTSLKTLVKFGAVAIVILAIVVSLFECVGINNDQDWKIVQYPNGKVEVVDSAGVYNKGYGHVWTYPRNFQIEYDKEHAFPVIFNDSGTGTMNTMVRFSAPLTIDGKREFHRQFGGNLENVEAAVWAHMSNSMKATGPIMSSSEHQSARRSEFDQLVQEQLNAGLFETKKASKEVIDSTDDKGKKITVYYTEIITDEKNKPKVANPSPLQQLGIHVTQFSVTHVQYDDTTQKQFEQKKQAFLAAESSKAQREKEVQERLMIEQRGLKEKAENEAAANKQKATATIFADQEKTVAETNAAKLVAVAQQKKIEAETLAAQEKVVAEIAAAKLVAVATQTKLEAETRAAQDLAVAKLSREAAEENARKQIVLAEAQKKSLELAGAISERDRVLAEIAAKRDVGVAAELSKIAVPSTIINGSGDGKNDLTANLVNLRLLEASGLLNKTVIK